MELQQQLFQGTHATGRTSYTPASTQNEQPPQFTPSAPGSFANPWDFDRFQSQLHDVEEQTQHIPNLNSPANPFMHQEPIYENPVQQTPVQQSRNIGSSSGIRRKRRVDTEEKMDAIVDYIHDRQVKKSRTTTESPHTDSPHTNSVRSTGSSLSYADLIARIKRLSEGADFTFGEALCIVTQPNNTDLFNALADEDAILWLSQATQAERVSLNYKAYLVNQAGGSK